MKRRIFADKSGFTLVEIMVYLAILLIIMTAVFNSFIKVTQPTFRQAEIAETKLETGLGMDLLRLDLEHAGFGLFWRIPTGAALVYGEPAPFSHSNEVPRALESADDSANSLNNADYLVIRATNVARSRASQTWGYVMRDASHNIVVQSMGDDAFANGDRVLVVRPEIAPSQYRQLVMNGGAWVTNPTAAALTNFAPTASPNDPNGERYLIYGIDDAAAARPFNRTDYYISNANVPAHCAPGTGVLVKAVANQADNNFTILPIVDCVADFQVVYHLDTDGDGGWDTIRNASSIAALNPQQIRDQVKEVRCYVLAHEGGRDTYYEHSTDTMNVGEVDAGGNLLAGRSFNIRNNIPGNWANYRWKVYSLAVTPKNLK
ncbi:MAG: prepilin-type N-terminal cleavage/methylation domain-containing protein [Dissulfuribacterales bacterium]